MKSPIFVEPNPEEKEIRRSAVSSSHRNEIFLEFPLATCVSAIINWRKSINEFETFVLLRIFLSALDIYQGLDTFGWPTDSKRSVGRFV